MYAVNYANRVESNTIKEFNTLDEAKAYANDFFKGYETFDGDDNDRISWCKCEVYDLSAQIEEGNFFELAPVYETELYWER